VILERLETAFNAPVLEAYAMTEASHMMTSNPLPQDGPRKPGSVGRPAGKMELAVLDEQGKEVPAGSPGEVCVRGANVTAGYKSNPAANAEAFAYGWFHTGDIGVRDDDSDGGYVRLVGRMKVQGTGEPGRGEDLAHRGGLGAAVPPGRGAGGGPPPPRPIPTLCRGYPMPPNHRRVALENP
jgi:acyl-CoA synthetase (AMP-forming)/AMP-acid ligase II